MKSLDSLLPQVSKPARYIGREWNAVVKDWDKASLRVALAYPDLYEVGMSNLGLAILYEVLNQQPQILAERVYTPWPDMAQLMRQERIPLFCLESQRPLRDFDLIGFSLGYELTYTNVLEMLDLAGIPLLAAERGEGFPLVVAGGGAALNPEPMADFIDLFVLGEGAEVVLELAQLLCQMKGAPKGELLRQAAAIPGIYVPSLYRAEYHPDGTLAGLSPLSPQAPPRIQRRLVALLPPPPCRPVMPYIEVVHDRGAVEIQRGCSRGCRFCQAGIIYRPVRERPVEEVEAAVRGLVRHCGYHQLSLLSLSTSDYSQIEELISRLSSPDDLVISLPSLRMDEFSVRLMDFLPQGKKRGLTFAPEAGTERLRRALNKGVSEEGVLCTIETAFHRGWTSLKLYFMLGLPTETEEDIEGIIALVGKGAKIGGRHRLKASFSPLVPKPHTPFQWLAQESPEQLQPKLERLSRGLRGVGMSWHNPQMSYIEGILSRGDRRLGQVILRAWQKGAVFDAWNESFSFERWREAFAEAGLSPEFYARERGREEVLPWGHIDVGVTKGFLWREYQRTFQGKETPDCRLGPCTACGLHHLHPECQRRVDSFIKTV